MRSYIENQLDNLYDFEDESLETETVDGTDYRFDPDFEPSVIVAQAFGADTGENSYNHALAESIGDAHEVYGELPVVAQSEVFERLEKDPYFEARDDVQRVFDNSGEADLISDYSTAEALEETADLLDEQGYDSDSALFVAHNAHMHRVLTSAEEAGIEGQPFVRDEVEWPENDKQEWVRSPENWGRREPLSRAHHWAYFNVPGAKTAFEKLGL